MKNLSNRTKIFIHVGSAILLVCTLITIVMMSISSYTRHDEFYTVPDLYNKTISNAKQLLEDGKMNLKVKDSVYMPNYKPGVIVEQRPNAKHKVKRERNISVIITASSPEDIVVPTIKNNAFRQTYNTLKNLGFNIGSIIYINHKYKNLVLELKYRGDSIPQGTKLCKGSNIDLVLAKGSNNYVYLPMILNKNYIQAKAALHSSYLNIGKINYDKSVKTEADKMAARVIGQLPVFSKNKKIEAGSKVSLLMSIDIKRIHKVDAYIDNLNNPKKDDKKGK